MPFDNEIQSFEVTGEELLNILKILQEGSKGYYQFWGLQTTIKETPDGSGNINKKIINATFYN